ncbi:hypothetical protein [Stenotrophomonas sp. YIM B06876]|uniref:hypothetical protein n=1 Tax=Stenotrophomonas sp. YIM B06876 TaxID=3060211 RepID=UPI0027388E8C|nr:hypothetical protein [Stenotrophomonas sp. YIM B06876]
MASRNSPRWLWPLLASAALAACSSETPPAASSKAVRVLDNRAAPAPAAVLEESERQRRVLAFLSGRYGAAASGSDAWRDQWHDSEVQALRPVHRHLCGNHAVMVDGVQHSLLAVCANLDEAASPEPGRIDFIVLRATAGDGLEVVMERLNDAHGSHGVPGEVSVLQLGAQRYGYRIDSGWFGQGYSLQTQSLLAMTGDGLHEAGSLRRHIDNGGAYDCASEDCAGKLFDVDFRLTADASQPDLAIWPLQVSESGTDCAGPLAREHRLAFDPVQGRYRIPETLQREGCL